MNLLSLNKNILFVDLDYNYNYLPIANEILLNRSNKNFYKLIRYFNVHAVFYLNMNKSNFIFNKLFSNNVINVSVNKNTTKKKMDLFLNFPDTQLYNYMLYVYIVNIYIKIKNKYKL